MPKQNAKVKVWECPKCHREHETPVLATAFYIPCVCGNKKDWKLKKDA